MTVLTVGCFPYLRRFRKSDREQSGESLGCYAERATLQRKRKPNSLTLAAHLTSLRGTDAWSIASRPGQRTSLCFLSA